MALTNKQMIAAQLLGCGARPGAVAKEVGIDESNLYRWRQTDEFRKAVANALNQALLDAGALALNELIAELGHDNPYLRQNAARELLNRYVNATSAASAAQGLVVQFGNIELGTPPANETDAPAQ